MTSGSSVDYIGPVQFWRILTRNCRQVSHFFNQLNDDTSVMHSCYNTKFPNMVTETATIMSDFHAIVGFLKCNWGNGMDTQYIAIIYF